MFELIGYNEEINSLIQNYRSNNLHSSIIIYGQQGIGKRMFINSLIDKILSNKHELNSETIGKLLFEIVNIARIQDIDPEKSLRMHNRSYKLNN